MGGKTSAYDVIKGEFHGFINAENGQFFKAGIQKDSFLHITTQSG